MPDEKSEGSVRKICTSPDFSELKQIPKFATHPFQTELNHFPSDERLIHRKVSIPIFLLVRTPQSGSTLGVKIFFKTFDVSLGSDNPCLGLERVRSNGTLANLESLSLKNAAEKSELPVTDLSRSSIGR